MTDVGLFFVFFFYSGISDIHTITSAFGNSPFFLECQGVHCLSVLSTWEDKGSEQELGNQSIII